MKESSIKTNYLLSAANTLSGLLFPLITFPYAARILQADGIGEVRFFDSIIGYILLISSLGIPLYAVREVARVRNNVVERSKCAIEIISLHTILTLFSYLIVLVIAFTVPKIEQNMPLFFILSSSLLFTTIGAQWFYQAMEDFKYITIRSLAVKVLMVIALFSLVRERDDLLWYAAVITGASVGNNIFNLLRLRKHISVSKETTCNLNIFRHLKPSLKIFTLNAITSVYALLDTSLLGFITTDTNVGYYATAAQISKMSLGVVISLGTVLLPRFSNYLNNGRRDEFIELGNKAINFTTAMVLPMCVGLVLLADPIIMLFAGNGYLPAITTLKLISPIIICIGFSYLIGMQLLYPQGKENIVIFGALAGATTNIILNLILIPKFKENGAAIASIAAECMVITVLLITGRKHLPFNFISRSNINYVIGTILMGSAVYLLSLLKLPTVTQILISVPCGIIVYALFLIIRRDYFVGVIYGMLLKKGR